MAFIILFDPVERILGIIGIAIGFICAMQYLIIGRKRQNSQEKILLYGFSLYLIAIIISSFFSFLLKYEVSGVYIGHSYYIDPHIFNYLPLFNFYQINLVIFEIGGIIVFILAFERVIKRTKYVITFLFIIRLIFYIVYLTCDYIIPSFSYYQFAIIIDFFLDIMSFVSVLMIPIILLLYSRWSEQEFKSISLYLIIGFILLTVYRGVYFNDSKLVSTSSPIMLIIGCFILKIPTFTNIKQRFNFWVLSFSLITLFFILIVDLYFTIISLSLYASIYIIILDIFAVLILCPFIIEMIKRKKK